MDKVMGPTVAAGRDVMTERTVSHGYMMALAFFAAYIVLDWLTYVFPARFGVTPFNPEAAVAVALLMFCGARCVPLVFLAVLWGEIVLPASVRPPALIVFNSIILTGGYAVMAYLLTRRFRISVELNTRRDVLHLLGVTLACMLVFGMVYVGVLVYFGVGSLDRYVNGARRFFIGYSVGVLVAAPLLFMAFSDRRRRQFAAFVRSPESWAQFLTIIVCVWWVFLQDQQDHIRNFYVLFLPLIWAATRFGLVGAASALALIQAGVLSVLVLSGYQPISVFELQLLLIALAITGLLLGVSIDEQQRAIEDFRESLKLAAAGEMAAAITHEINQPLTALSGYAAAGQLIASAPDIDRAQLHDTMRKLMDESKRTSAVVRRLRDFFQSGETRLEPINLGGLALQTVDALRAKAQAANVMLDCRLGEAAPTVMVDPVQIEVVLRNLLLNGIESAAAANPAAGRVQLELAADGAGEVTVAVTDNGGGIREADVPLLFESFVTTKTSGMGMGLAISRAIVEAHGGRIWAVPGATGRFGFTLPADAVVAAGRVE